MVPRLDVGERRDVDPSRIQRGIRGGRLVSGFSSAPGSGKV